MSVGSKVVLDYLLEMEEEPYTMEIVAPKGGLLTVLVTPVLGHGQPPVDSREQVYGILHDRLAEVIDLGRTPAQVERPESQPT